MHTAPCEDEQAVVNRHGEGQRQQHGGREGHNGHGTRRRDEVHEGEGKADGAADGHQGQRQQPQGPDEQHQGQQRKGQGQRQQPPADPMEK